MKKYIFSILSAAVGIACFAAFNLIGSKVLEDGTLSEPFGLIPIGYLFIFIGVISALVVTLVSKIRQASKKAA
ncbi:MAG: DUF3955 domain-containing protein [Anaerolineaceae bacterium]|nr:DUF3955 domain-containing protein [Anaerolineaceae bacterium]